VSGYGFSTARCKKAPALAVDLIKITLMVLVWQPITDLPQDWQTLSDGELGPLLRFWNDQRLELEQSGALTAFSQRLAREWSIETGQIEGVYDIDRGITETLIERGIRADLIPTEPNKKSPELVAAIIQDHYQVLEGLFQFVRGERNLTKGYIHELHAALLRHQNTTVVMDQFGELFEARLSKGRYKERPNNPKRPDGYVHQYSPPEQVDSEIEKLLIMHEKHEALGVPVEIEAAWVHHRFAQIHPYQDGNGRVARALASLIFIKRNWFPVVVTRDDRARYIDALEVADAGDLRSLVAFLVDVQKRALFQATQAAADTQKVETIDDAIAAAKRVLAGPGKSLDPGVWVQAKNTADKLMELAGNRLQGVAASLKREISEVRPEYDFTTTTGFFGSMGVSNEELGYKPNKEVYERDRRLALEADSIKAQIEVQAHGIGSKFRGLIGIVVVFFGGSKLEFGTKKTSLASRETFQVNYAESYEQSERRFLPWLDESLVNALTIWRKGL
jgi:Fic family protein